MLTTDTHVFFYSGRQAFSNWHHSPDQLIMRGLSFDHSEGAFMAMKAWFFMDLDAVAACHAEKDPCAVKAIGRTIRGYDDAAWSLVRLGFMAYVNLLKYRQNPEMAAELLGTGDRTLVEASPVDQVWGVGLAEDDPLIQSPSNWRGTNLLGVALMQVREVLRGDARRTARG